jgi:hypothetical protein
MFKKMMLVAVSVAALVAFAAPAAQAVITDSNGNTATKITAEGTNVVTSSPQGELKCATVKLFLHLTNPPTTYSGTGTASGHVNEATPHQKVTCTVNNIPVTINSITVNHVETDGAGGGTAAFSFTFTIGHVLMCNNVGEGAISYTPTTSTINLEGEMVGTENVGAGCPATSTIGGVFHVLDELKKPTSIH